MCSCSLLNIGKLLSPLFTKVENAIRNLKCCGIGSVRKHLSDNLILLFTQQSSGFNIWDWCVQLRWKIFSIVLHIIMMIAYLCHTYVWNSNLPSYKKKDDFSLFHLFTHIWIYIFNTFFIMTHIILKIKIESLMYKLSLSGRGETSWLLVNLFFHRYQFAPVSVIFAYNCLLFPKG